MKTTDTTNAPKIQTSAATSNKTKTVAAVAQQPSATLGRDTFQRSSEVVGSRPNVFTHESKAVWAGIHNKEFLADPGYSTQLPPSRRKETDLNRASATGEDLPTFFKHLREVSKGQHVYLEIDSHGGGGNGVVFTATDPKDPTTRLVNVYSMAYINKALQQAGFKPEDVTLLYEGCNSATAAYRSSQGFSSRFMAEVEKNETRWQKEDFPGTKQVKVTFHDVATKDRGHVVEFPAVGRMSVNTLSVEMQFRLGKAQIKQDDWKTGIYWIDHQKKAPRFSTEIPAINPNQQARSEFFNAYEKMAKEEAPSFLSRLFAGSH